MKLRIKGNSLRLRLTLSEVEKLNSSGWVSESVSFGAGNQFIYTVKASDRIHQVSAGFENGEMLVTVPVSEVENWAASDQVSIEETGLPVTIVIEKDFACLQPRRDEDETDLFLNPGTTLCTPK